MNALPPVVLSLSGHDPTGGAGIQADIETLARLGCYACTVITALTVQDTVNVRRVIPQPAGDFLEQARTVLGDLPVAVVKIGLLGSAEIAEAVAAILAESPDIPAVIDPILAAGGGKNLADARLLDIMRARLLPRATVLTPNIPEARTLAGADDPDACGRALLALGCESVLLTGTHEDGLNVINRLYRPAGVETYRWPRLSATYHGSGCTLASAVAGYLARGIDLESAVREAQGFCWNALDKGLRLGRGQMLPNRLCPEIR